MSNKTLYRQQNREIFSNNLKKLALRYGKTQNDLVVELEISQATISDWWNAKSMPRDERLNKVADYFSISTAELLLDPDEIIEINDTIEIPVYRQVSCGDPTPEIDEVVGYIYIDEALSKRGEYFAVRAKGDSMLPKVEDGDVLLVRKQKSVNSGEVAIVKVNGDEATCKKVNIRADGLFLQPFNANYESFFYSKEQIIREPVEILGRVIEVRKKL